MGASRAEPAQEAAAKGDPAGARDVGGLEQLSTTAGNAVVSRLLGGYRPPPPAPPGAGAPGEEASALPSARRPETPLQRYAATLAHTSPTAAPFAPHIGIAPTPMDRRTAVVEAAPPSVTLEAAPVPAIEVTAAPEAVSADAHETNDDPAGERPSRSPGAGPLADATIEPAEPADGLDSSATAVDVDVAPARGPPAGATNPQGPTSPVSRSGADEPPSASHAPPSVADGATGAPATESASLHSTASAVVFSAATSQRQIDLSGSAAPGTPTDVGPAEAVERAATPLQHPLATVQRQGCGGSCGCGPCGTTGGGEERDEHDGPALQRRSAPAGPTVQRRAEAASDARSPAAASSAAMAVSRKANDEEALGPEPEPDPNDVDTSEFSNDPRAAAELAKIPNRRPPSPPPAPTGPPPPVKPKQMAKGRRTPKPPKGPRPKGRRGTTGPGAKGKGGAGEIVRKKVPPAPPRYRFTPGMKVAPPVPVDTRKPKEDPALVTVTMAGKQAVKDARKHPSGKDESAASQLAAKAPANDTEAQAKAGHADTMATAKPKEFSADAFYTAVKAALDKASPKNFEEAQDLDGKASGMKDAVKATVGSSKGEAASDVTAKAGLPPDPSVAVAKPEAPMTTTEIPEPKPVKASGAMPAPVPSEQLDLRAGPAKVDQDMADAGVTEDQLKESNEPEFGGALEAKKEGEEHASTAPGEVRQAEAGILGQAGAQAASAEKAAIGGANAKIGTAETTVGGTKDATKQKDEKARKDVADNVTKIYDTAKTEVDGILAGLDKKVETAFEQGEARIRTEFTADWNQRLKAYKSRRYSGLRGKYRWVRDKFKGLPEAANTEYEASRRIYESKMDRLARDLSKLVATELNAATRRIEKGRQDVAAYVGTLKGELAKVGQEAAADLADKFDDLDAGVKDKFDELASTISKRWAESRDAVNKEIEEAKEANKGLIDKAMGAIKGVLRTIANLKDLILNVISKVASAIGDIIRAPIRFLKNFVTAVKEGVSLFSTNILEHLKKGMMGWLFGALGVDDLEIPDSFDVKGMMQVVLQVLGITWASIRASFVKHIGEPGVAAVEKGSDIVQKLIREGPVALWEMLLEKVGDFEDMVLGRIKDFVVEKVVKAGITFLLSLLNPAAAFIKACKMIYDIITWLISNGSQIMEFIHTVVDSIVDIAKGGVGGVPQKIESVLAKLLPLAIGFLASIIGLGGVGDKVRSIIDRVRSPITKAKDAVVKTIVNLTKPIWGAAKKLVDKGKKLYEKGKKKVKAGVAHAGKKVKAGAEKVRAKVTGLFKKQEKGLSMAGATHTLKATPNKDGRFVISMATQEMLLSKKIGMSVASLEENLAVAAPAQREQIERQIKELREIQTISVKLERAAAATGGEQVLANGAPPGFAEEMTKLAGRIEAYGTKNKVKDITKATPGAVIVDIRLLSRFGLPMPSYLQAQKVADDTGTAFDVRATNLTAAKLYETGANPKSEEFKQKTLNDADLLLGAPVEHLGKVAWFLPRRPDKAVVDKLMGEEGGRSVAERWWSRWRQRKDEYYEYAPKLRKKLREGDILIHEQVGASGGGGVIRNAFNGLPYTGDHDLYAIHGNPDPVITGLKPSPFHVQHGAHVDWIRLPKVVAKGGLSPAEMEIFTRIMVTHAPGGEALLRVSPKAPPAAVSSATPPGVRGKAPTRGGSTEGQIDGTVVQAGPPVTGFAALVAAEKRVAEQSRGPERPGGAGGGGPERPGGAGGGGPERPGGAGGGGPGGDKKAAGPSTGKGLGADDSPEGKQRRLDAAMNAAVPAVNRLAGKPVGKDALTPILDPIREEHRLTSLTPVKEGRKWAVVGEVNPKKKRITEVEAPGGTASGPCKMRAQIQEKTAEGADHHWGSASVTAADEEKGVTAYEFEKTQAAAKKDALANSMPRDYLTGTDPAKAEQSKRIRTRTIPAGGIGAERVGDINELRVCIDRAGFGLVTCRPRGQIRLDVENLAGHNLSCAR